ncbi:unnamed protein product [Menidia menidia]|uniref:(Atlantic silverside) hypothetical protein n=1 Tax=Menidia menidia TaxID=238744 RepID=A0A8S4AHE8_9TELE|nr:unnamed protein product [Menidia menidia]
MRVFLCYESFCEQFDVSPEQTIGALKKTVKDIFLLQLLDDGHIRQTLELNHGGAVLQDSWALRDIGITSGSTILCAIKSERRPVIHVFNAVTGESLPIMGSQCLLNASVSQLKTMVSVQSSLPVSAFSLSTPAGVPLYDCNLLNDYGIEMGSNLHLDTWDGWVEFLQGCLQGNRGIVQKNLSSEEPIMRFQLQVALYVAASLGHLDLANWLLKMGVSAAEPVGVHPFRQWCQQSDHRDANKCPIHVAVQSNQLLILKLFVTKNLLTLARLDPAGLDPLKIAIKHGHRECARYLVSKLFSAVSVLNTTLPVRIYLRIKRWVSLGKKRASSSWRHYTGAALKAKLGSKLLVDGFHQGGLFSKSMVISWGGMKARALPPLPPIRNFNLRSHPSPKTATQPLPILQSEKRMQRKPCKRNREGGSYHCKQNFGLPPLSKDDTSRHFVCTAGESLYVLNASLKSSHHCGLTQRGNAARCMTIASTFTEKPWLKQLNIARCLVRKHADSWLNISGPACSPHLPPVSPRHHGSQELL